MGQLLVDESCFFANNLFHAVNDLNGAHTLDQVDYINEAKGSLAVDYQNQRQVRNKRPEAQQHLSNSSQNQIQNQTTEGLHFLLSEDIEIKKIIQARVKRTSYLTAFLKLSLL